MMKTDNPKVKQLFMIGQPSINEEWPDYISQFDFNNEDIPELLKVLSYDRPCEDDDTLEGWAPLHAWRVLGLLCAKEAIEPILERLASLTEDEWALDEFPTVFGLIGPTAIESLQCYWEATHEEEACYEMVADSLGKIAEFYPDARYQVIETFRKYLEKPIVSCIRLNGVLVDNIVALKAVELIDEVRQLFKLGCVDLTILGDIEEVEIELGLRETRKTPALKWTGEELFISEKLSDNKNLAQAEKWLKKYADVDSEAIDSLSELDGYFTAVACSPQIIHPSTVMPELWGGPDSIPVFDSHKESEKVVKSLFDHYNLLLDQLDSKTWQPIFKHYKNDKTVVSPLDWCYGFLRGYGLWGDVPNNISDTIVGNLAPILYCTRSESFPYNARIHIQQVKTFYQAIEQGVKNIYQLTEQHKAIEGNGLTYMRDTPKLGRNDPCSCGSGKKYKKCCGK